MSIPEWLEVPLVTLAGIIGISAVVVFFIWVFHYPYQMTGVYCNYYNQGCVYRQRGIGSSTCPEWWDNNGSFDKVNNLKLKPGTCHTTYEGNF